MRTEAEILANATDRPPFSNGTECQAWMSNWCDRCHNPAELAYRRYKEGKRKTRPKNFPGGCPILAVAELHQKTPLEWIEQEWSDDGPSLYDRYHCIEFCGPDDGDGEPKPKPEPTNMDGLFPRPPRQRRTLKPINEALTTALSP